MHARPDSDRTTIGTLLRKAVHCSFRSPDHLKSNLFNVSIKGNIAVFEGYGIGQGVGLCLYSAKQMAERGDNAVEILAQFFPGMILEKMPAYPDPIFSTHKGPFPSPKKREGQKKKHRLLH